jgi:MoaA/NifB/PqqE/SkfB family radical SAM enzyme
MWRFCVLRKVDPLIYGIAVTDRCNFACKGCTVANTGRPQMSWNTLVGAMQRAHSRGFRELYFSGGEPMLWQDGDRRLPDAIEAASRIGFFHVHVYTNGTRGIPHAADVVWVSMDGLPGTFERRRGNHFDEVERAVRTSRHPSVAIIYVIDRDTASGIRPFLEWVRDTAFPVAGVMFYFHTPYYGIDRLYLDRDERAVFIDELLSHIREGLPVMNSTAGLKALRSGRWRRRMPIASVLDVDGEWVCCRASDETCENCGYAACTELTELQRLRPSAVRGILRYW